MIQQYPQLVSSPLNSSDRMSVLFALGPMLRHGLARIWIGLALFMGFSLQSGIAEAAYATDCATSGCHLGQAMNDPTLGRVNAANSLAIIQRANTLNGMGRTLTQMTNAAAEIGGVVAQTQNDNINFGATKSFTVNNLLFGGVIDQLVYVSGPAVTTSVAGSAGSFSYTHPGGASGTCATQNVVVKGRGTDDFGFGVPAADTSNRTVSISINPPAAPTAVNDSVTLNYSTAAQAIDLAAIGAVSGTVRATGTTPSLGTPSPNVGTVIGTGPETLTYAANATVYAPTVTVTFNVTGPCSTTSTTRTLTINVNAPPVPVVANAGPFSVAAASATANVTTLTSTGVVQSNPAGTYDFAIASQPPAGEGTVSLSGANNSVVTYTPSPPGTFTGTTSFTYTRTGPGGTSAPATVTLTVTSAPLAGNTSVTTAYNTAIPVNVAPLITGTFTTVTGQNPVNGTVGTVGSTVTFTPTPGFFGTGSFEYTATGPGGTSSPGTVTVTVNPPVPTASNGTATVPYNTATAINLSAFISPSSTVTSVTPSGASNGTAVATGPTTVTFTPTSGHIGAASFNYTATNATGTSASATISVTVSAPLPPVASGLSVGVPASVPTAITLSGSITGIATSISIASLPARGLVTVSGLGVIYTPAAGFVGSDSFTYTATGPGGTSAPATVSIVVIAAPTVGSLNVNVPYQTPTPINIDAVIGGIATSYVVVTNPSHGSFGSSPTGALIYVPANGYHGPDSFVIVVNGPGGTSAPATVNITVIPPPPAPGTLTVTGGFNSVLVIDLSKAVNGVATSFSVSEAPLNGTLVISGVMATYTPKPGFSGDDTFIVIPSGPGGTGTATTIRITIGTQVPTARAASMIVQLNQSLTLDVASLISGSGITGVNVVTQPRHGTADVAGTKLIYTPRTDYFGSDTFTYIAFGNAGSSTPATISVTVEGRPNPSQDKTVNAVLTAQTQVAQRFARAQQSNFQQRLESLRSGLAVGEETVDKPAQTSLRSRAPATGHTANIHNRATTVADAADPFAPLQSGNEIASGLSGLGVKGPPVDTGISPTWVSTLLGVVTGRSLDLGAASAGLTGQGGTAKGETSLWIAGNVNLGRRDATADAVASKYSTDGVSFGADRRLGERVVAGLGFGFGRDETDVGNDGSRLKAKGVSVAGYGSYQVGPNTFVDGLLGFGRLDLDTRRFVTSANEFALSKRKGDQLFGSIAASYEWRRDALLVSPYGRVDFSRDRLKVATESGAGLAALTYLEQTQRSTQLALGLRAEIQHQSEFGWVKPRARIEYRHELESDRVANVAYADQYPAGNTYAISSAGNSRNSLVVGVGADFLYRGGLKLGIDYQAVRLKGPESNQAVRLFITQDLDAKSFPANAVAWKTGKDAVRVEAGYSWDDNVTRARDESSQFSDRIFNLGFSYGRFFPLGSNSRLGVNGFFSGEKFRSYPGLGSASFGAQGELQYRTSAAFDAITFGAFARISYDEFESRLRDGHRYAVGINARQSLTDRIDVFGELAGTVRYARSAVFDRRDFSIRGNVDYMVSKKGTLYLTGEFRRGDTVSTGFPSLENLNIAEVLVQDDAYVSGQMFSYRVDAKTILGTVGYNLSLGPRDSLDFSWRRAQAKPLQGPGFQVPGSFRYVANQYSVVYLTRF